MMFCAAVVLVLVLAFAESSKAETGRPLTIGAQIETSKSACEKKWASTVVSLEKQIKRDFTLDCLNKKEFGEDKARKYDFLILDQITYVDCEERIGAMRIATLMTGAGEHATPYVGSVLITEIDGAGADSLKRLKSGRAVIQDPGRLDGWLAVKRELKRIGYDPDTFFGSIEYEKNPAAIIGKVHSGEADAGVMGAADYFDFGKKYPQRVRGLRIVGLREDGVPKRFAYESSTRLYPGWAFASNERVPFDFEEKMAVALISMHEMDSREKHADAQTWVVPPLYSSVRELMKELHIDVYKDYGKLTFADIAVAYKRQIAFVLLLIVFLASCVFIFAIFNGKLKRTGEQLSRELVKQRTAQQEIERLAEIVKYSNDAVISETLDGTVLSWNKAAEAMYGYSESEMIGEKITKIVPVDKIEFTFSNLDKIRNGIVVPVIETERKRKDAVTIHVSQNISPIKNSAGEVTGASIIARDITELALSRMALEESEARIRAILDTAVEAIITIDENGFIETFNQAAEMIFGYSAGEVVGRNVSVLMPTPFDEHHTDYIKRYISTGVRKVIGIGREGLGLRKNGDIFPLDLSISEVRFSGRRIFTGILRDITERKEVERMKNEFISTVSHELRTPLTSIRGSLGLIAGGVYGELDPEVMDLIRIASGNTDRLVRLINDMLDIEKIESGKMHMDFKLVSLDELVGRALEEMRGFAGERQVTLEAASVPYNLSADFDRLLQVLDNLISNAVKFSKPGGKVQITASQDEKFVSVSVRDFGEGIPESFIPHVFSKFHQADGSVTRSKGGTGLGLAICKAIVEGHCGKIAFESEEGKGAVFTIFIPRYEYVQMLSRPCAGIAPQEKVLVVEGDEQIRALLLKIISEAGFDVMAAADVAQAADVLSDEKIGAAVVSIDMPEGYVFDLIKDIETAQGEAVPVVLLGPSGAGGFSSPEAFPPVFDWLSFPLDEARLVKVLKKASRGNSPPRVLVIDDDEGLLMMLSKMLSEKGVEVAVASSGRSGVEMMPDYKPDLIVLDIVMPEGDGFYVVEMMRKEAVLNSIPLLIYTSKDLTSDDADRLKVHTTEFITKLRVSEGEFTKKVIAMLNGLMPDSEAEKTPEDQDAG